MAAAASLRLCLGSFLFLCSLSSSEFYLRGLAAFSCSVLSSWLSDSRTAGTKRCVLQTRKINPKQGKPDCWILIGTLIPFYFTRGERYNPDDGGFHGDKQLAPSSDFLTQRHRKMLKRFITNESNNGLAQLDAADFEAAVWWKLRPRAHWWENLLSHNNGRPAPPPFITSAGNWTTLRVEVSKKPFSFLMNDNRWSDTRLGLWAIWIWINWMNQSREVC